MNKFDDAIQTALAALKDFDYDKRLAAIAKIEALGETAEAAIKKGKSSSIPFPPPETIMISGGGLC